MSEIKSNNHEHITTNDGFPAQHAVMEHCPTCGRRLKVGEMLRKCGQCGQWLCESGERALSCTGWLYCPLCRTMARAEWLEAAQPLPATT